MNIEKERAKAKSAFFVVKRARIEANRLGWDIVRLFPSLNSGASIAICERKDAPFSGRQFSTHLFVNDPGHFVSGVYDLTEEEAIKSFHERKVELVGGEK